MTARTVIATETTVIDIRYAPVRFGMTAVALTGRRYVGAAFETGGCAAGDMTAITVIAKPGMIRFTRKQPVISAMTAIAGVCGLYVGT